MKKGNFRKPRVFYHEMLQTSNSTDLILYNVSIEVYYHNTKEVLAEIDDQVEILYPIFCQVLQNVQNLESNENYKQKFKANIPDTNFSKP